MSGLDRPLGDGEESERFSRIADNLSASSRGIELRTAGADDQDLVRRITAMTMSWRSADTPYELPAEAEKYFEGWGRADDLGVLAFSGIEFVGGAFVRRFGAADGAYGYVSDDYPELGIAIESGYRRRGLGVLLLAATKAKVIEKGMSGISLSVEPDNGARHLYSKLGFELVEDRGHDLLMLWRR